MPSQNFEFLRPLRPELADLAGYAESYAHPDPASAMVKLRLFAERLTLVVFDLMGLPASIEDKLLDMLREPAFESRVPKPVLDLLHLIRRSGNRGAHGKPVSSSDALNLLRETRKLAEWLHLSYDQGQRAAIAPYRHPDATAFSQLGAKEQEREREKLQRLLEAKEADTLRLLDELKRARAEADIAAKSEAELRALQHQGVAHLDELKFDEATTRKQLIDRLLLDAGWNVGLDGASTEEVGQEVEVDGQPTATGQGSCDYVLYAENGKPLAVVEAKKTAEEPAKGRQQAKLYADALENRHGGFRPVIFYTNGYEIWIWNDAAGDTPRRLFGFYAPDSLKSLIARRHAKPLQKVSHDPQIIDRLYQIEAIKRVTDDLTARKRRGLIVMATGTGKTRVAVALCDLLNRAGQAVRILFLCDRLELRKQAHNAFKQFLPGEPRTYVTAKTSEDRNWRIYLATYPAMLKAYETFDPGFFDLVIADESHRSIYNRYRNILTYFDAIQIGLTATPVHMVHRNTYQLFERPALDPTFSYSLEKAVEEGNLVPFVPKIHTTGLLRSGIKWAQLTPEQQEILQDQDDEAEFYDFRPGDLDRAVFNKDTNRHIIRNLMESGIRDSSGSRPGKSIIFARNHQHAILLEALFHELYPQYGGTFCRVIDNYDPRAETLIDEFKDPSKNLTIAISVDMLDTGIDVPEVVNLVFAKPVFSVVKFWQMIGRGTRLCRDLFGPGTDKKEFLIFDHWGNFERFDVTNYQDRPDVRAKAVLEQLFEARIDLAEVALQKFDETFFGVAIDLIQKDIQDLPEHSVPVRERWRHVLVTKNAAVLRQFEPQTQGVLRNEIARLMQWRDIGGDADAYRFDLLIARMQLELMRQSASFANLRDDLIDQVLQLPRNLTQVKAKAQWIQKIETPDAPFWSTATCMDLEDLRVQLRGIMRYRQRPTGSSGLPPKIIDVPECVSETQSEYYTLKTMASLDQAAYRQRVERVLRDLEKTSSTLQRIKRGEPVTSADLDALQKLILVQDSNIQLALLQEFYGDLTTPLDFLIRRIIGLDAEAVEREFVAFATRYPSLTARQVQFLDLLKNHIRRFGAIELKELYEAPFTSLHSDGVDGVFTDGQQVDYLLSVIQKFQPQNPEVRPYQ